MFTILYGLTVAPLGTTNRRNWWSRSASDTRVVLTVLRIWNCPWPPTQARHEMSIKTMQKLNFKLIELLNVMADRLLLGESDLLWIHIRAYWFSGWWFQTIFIFPNIWDNPSHWRTPSFFRGVGQPPTSFPLIFGHEPRAQFSWDETPQADGRWRCSSVPHSWWTRMSWCWTKLGQAQRKSKGAWWVVSHDGEYSLIGRLMGLIHTNNSRSSWGLWSPVNLLFRSI